MNNYEAKNSEEGWLANVYKMSGRELLNSKVASAIKTAVLSCSESSCITIFQYSPNSSLHYSF